MNKTLRFIVSAVLIAALVFSSLVFAGAAAVVTDMASLKAAIGNDGEIVINNDINYTEKMSISGKTITFRGTGTVTFPNNDGMVITDSSNVIIDGPTFVQPKSALSGTRALVIENGYCTVNSGGFSGFMDVQGNGYLTINGGTFTQINTTYLLRVKYSSSSYGRVYINGGTFARSASSGASALLYVDYGHLYINGGDFTQPLNNNLISTTSGNAPNQTVIINGGTFHGTNSSNTLIYSYGKLNVNGGKILAYSTTEGNSVAGTAANITVRGGSFNKHPHTDITPAVGFTTSDDGMYHYGTHVTNGTDFVTAVKAGGTVYVDADFDCTEKISMNPSNVNLKGSGTVTFTSTDGLILDTQYTTVKANLVVDGPTLKAVTSNTRALVIWGGNVVVESGGITGFIDAQGASGPKTQPNSLVINGGTFTQSGNNDSAKGYLLRAGNNTSNACTTVINGGNFVGAGTVDMLYVNTYARLSIKGGTFTKASGQTGITSVGKTFICGGTFNFNPSTWVTEGYEATASGDKWTVDVEIETKRTVSDFAALKQAIADNIPEIEIVGTINADGRLGGYYDKTITFTGAGEVVFDASSDSGFHIYGGCDITFDGPSFRVADTVSRAIVIYDSSETVNVTINAGTFTGSVQAQKNANLTINGGTFNTKDDNGKDKNALMTDSGNDKTVVINGGTFNSTGEGMAVRIAGGNFTVNGGTFNNSSSGQAISIVGSSDATTAVKNATIVSSGSGASVYVASGKTMELEGCTVTKSSGDIKTGSGGLKIISGTYNFDPTDYVDFGSEIVSNGDGTYTVSPAQPHPLAEAIYNASAGDTITVNEDYSGDNAVPAITIDKDLTFTGSGTIAFGGAGFEIVGADVTFGGNLTVTMADNNNGGNRIFDITEGSSLTINSGEFTGNGGSSSDYLIKLNDGSSALKIYGGEFTLSGSGTILLIGNVGTLEIGTLGSEGPKMTATGSGTVVSFNTGSGGVANTSANINFNAGTFKQTNPSTPSGQGYNIYFNMPAKSPININGGTWTTASKATIYVNDGGIEDLRINGGTFETTTSSEQTVYKQNGTLTITGGEFINNSAYSIICTAVDRTTGALTINDAADATSEIIMVQKGSGSLIEHRSKLDLNIIDSNLTNSGDGTGAGVVIDRRTVSNVTITNSNITTAGSALVLGNTDTAVPNGTTVTATNSTFTSTGSRGIDNRWGVVSAGVGDTNYYDTIPSFTKDSATKIVDSAELRTNGQPKMFRFAGGGSGTNVVAVSATTASLASGDYTLTLNYRETGGAWPYVGVTAGGKTTKITAENADTFEDGVIVYNFSAEGEVKVSLGRETMHAAGAVYFGNVKLTANGSATNLLDSTFDNGDLARSPINTLTAGNAGTIIPGWTNVNIGSFHGARVMEIPSDDFFTADNPVTAENYVYKFEDGDNMDVNLRFHMTEDTNYEFSYTYMSSDGNLRNKLYQGGMDRPFSMNIEQDEDTYKTIVKYTLGNDGDSTVENEGTTIYIDGPEDAYGSIQYLGNFEMYEIDGAGNRITGRNLLAGFSPMYEAEGDLSHLGTYPMVTDSAVSSKLENAYGVYFRNDSSETDVASIVKVDDNFFKKSSFAERRGDARRYLIENEIHTDLAYDYSADKAVNVIDLLKVKKYESGFVGADDKAEQLKNEILGTGDTVVPSGKTVYYVSNSGNDSNTGTSKDKPFATLAKAISKAAAGNYILLERGGEWRMPSSTNGSGWELTKGVTIGSYTGNKGTDKPVLIGSAYNYAEKTWTEVSDNIWKTTLDKKGSANIPGNLYFFTNKTDKEPSLVGTIVKDNSPIGQTWNTSTDEWDKVNKTPAEMLSRNGEVYRDYDAEEASWLEQLLGISGQKNDVYVYYDGNLTEDFKKIEITESRDLFFAADVSGITIDNIAIKYVGAHGINLRSCDNATISNCEIGWIGGSPSGNSALGNGIQFGVEGTNLIATHNYIYQSYDAGITPQNWKTSNLTNYNFANVQITNNLLTNNFDNIEFWNDDGAMEMTVDGNILKDAAYCWSWNQRIKTGNVSMFGCHIYGGRNAYNDQLELEFTNNIFDNTQANIFCWFWGGKDNAAELPATFPTTGSHYMILSGNSYYQKAGSNSGGQVNYYGNTTDPAYASSQKAFEDVVRVLDPEAADAGRVTYLQQWLTDLVEQGDNEMVYKNITVNSANISDYVIVNETSTEYGTLSVNSAIKAVTGEYLAVADSAPANGKAVRIITNTALAPNTVKVYVNNGTLYIAGHDTLFVDDAISVFKGILEDGKLTFANGYEKTITLSSYTYEGKSGLRLIGESDKNPVSYNVGETATINIAGYASNGQIISVPQFKVTVYSEATGQTTTTTYSGTTGVCSFTVSSNTAGFVYWTVVACDSNGNKISGFAEVDSGVHYSGSVGFGVNSIAKSSTKPSNFDSNWAAAATEVASTSATATTMESVSANSGYEAYRVVIPYANAGGFVTGYLTYPKDAAAGSLGLMLRFQGNSVAIPDKNYDANAAVFTVCAHSLDLTSSSTQIEEFKNTINKGGNNFAWDNETFDTSYLVKMVKRDLLAGKFMIDHFTENGLWNGTSFTAMGTSMGGFQSIAVAALLDDVTGKNVTTLNVSLPWLCDLGAETNNRKDSTWRPTYAYADTVHFATMLGNVDEIIVNAGLGDVICPASGVMAFYNTIDNDNKSITFRQNNTHSGGYNGAYYTIVG